MIEVVKPDFLPTKKGKFLCHSNEKGGVGKTTVGFYQGFRLAEQGYRVLFCDIDGQCNMSSVLSRTDKSFHPSFTSADLFNPSLDKGNIEVYRSEVHENIYFIPSHKEKIASILASPLDAATVVGTLRKHLQNIDFDYVIFDTPPSLGITQVAAIAAVDYIFVPITIDDFSNEGMISLLKTIRAVSAGMKVNPQVACIYLNLFKKPTERKGSNPYADIYTDIKRNYSSYLLPEVIPDSLIIKEARMGSTAPWVSPLNFNHRQKGKVVRDAIDAMNNRMKN